MRFLYQAVIALDFHSGVLVDEGEKKGHVLPTYSSILKAKSLSWCKLADSPLFSFIMISLCRNPLQFCSDVTSSYSFLQMCQSDTLVYKLSTHRWYHWWNKGDISWASQGAPAGCHSFCKLASPTCTLWPSHKVYIPSPCIWQGYTVWWLTGMPVKWLTGMPVKWIKGFINADVCWKYWSWEIFGENVLSSILGCVRGDFQEGKGNLLKLRNLLLL